MTAIINGINKQNEKLKIEGSKYLVLSIQYLIDILSDSSFKIGAVEA